jgi:putative endonuclease
MQRFYVYIMTNRRRTLYIGVTNDLPRRILEHKQKTRRGFTRKYDMTMLAWFEEFYTADQAILAEKKMKGWLRSKKVALIESINPDWQDLAAPPPVILSQAKNLAAPIETPDPSLHSG